jgi:hypothetical protein
MTNRNLVEINWTAAFIGFGVDLAFTELVGLFVMAVILGIRGISPETGDDIPPDVELVFRFVGVLGALVGGMAAGYLARHHGTLHGVLASLIGLMVFLCAVPLVGGAPSNIGDLGFIVLNLIGAGYGGGVGERWRERRKGID